MTTKQERAERAGLEAKLRKRCNDRIDAMEKARSTAHYLVLKSHGFEPEETDWDEIPVWLSRVIDEADERAEEAAQAAVKAATEAAEEAAFKSELEIYAREYAEQHKRTSDAEKKPRGGPLDVVSRPRSR